MPGVPGPLQPLARLLLDYGNLARYEAENRKVQPPTAGEEREARRRPMVATASFIDSRRAPHLAADDDGHVVL